MFDATTGEGYVIHLWKDRGSCTTPAHPRRRGDNRGARRSRGQDRLRAHLRGHLPQLRRSGGLQISDSPESVVREFLAVWGGRGNLDPLLSFFDYYAVG